MRYDILMKVISVKPVNEIIMGRDECSEIVITFDCETPLGESDTCAMFARYFEDVYFEEHDNDTFIQKGDIFDMHGVIRVSPSKKTDMLAPGEMLIPISSELKQQIISQKYEAKDSSDSAVMVESWFSDLLDKDND